MDLYRAFVFPNRIREHRRARGFPKLLRLATALPDIPYIRLSKIERGEVVPRTDELRRIAAILGVAPADLLLDIDAPGFDIAAWAEPFRDGTAPDLDAERFAVLLGAALRVRRTRDAALTIAVIEREYGLPPVNLSRVENAQKTFDRWNVATRQALFALFGVPNEAALRAQVEAQHRSGALDRVLAALSHPGTRQDRTRARIAEVRAALATPAPAPVTTPHAPFAAAPAGGQPIHAPMPVRLLPVFGAPLADGLIADQRTLEQVEGPRAAGPRAFGLKVCRATLGAGLPAQAVVIADPDRAAVPGGIVALREDAGWRLLSVGADREGRMVGYSLKPALEVDLDSCDPAAMAAVVSAIFP